MLKHIKKSYYNFGAAFTAGMLATSTASATPPGGGGGNTFSTIASNINSSIEDLPGLLTALAYLFGILLGVLGILKIKDHVENPSQTPLKDGAIRLAAGGALFALVIVFEAMLETVGSDGAATEAATLKKAGFNVE
jgi:hypothetical protein